MSDEDESACPPDRSGPREPGVPDKAAGRDRAPVAPLPDLYGAMRGSVRVPPGVDLTEPTCEPWEAEA